MSVVRDLLLDIAPMCYCFLLCCDLLLTTQLTWLGPERTPLLTEVPFSMSQQKWIVYTICTDKGLYYVIWFL